MNVLPPISMLQLDLLFIDKIERKVVRQQHHHNHIIYIYIYS